MAVRKFCSKIVTRFQPTEQVHYISSAMSLVLPLRCLYDVRLKVNSKFKHHGHKSSTILRRINVHIIQCNYSSSCINFINESLTSAVPCGSVKGNGFLSVTKTLKCPVPHVWQWFAVLHHVSSLLLVRGERVTKDNHWATQSRLSVAKSKPRLLSKRREVAQCVFAR